MLLHQKKNHYLRIGLAITAVITAMALVGCFWTPYAPTAMSGSEKFAAPSLRHLFGTDNFGRDIFSRVMVGARTTFFISACTVTIGAVVGTLVGALTGYFGGLVDELLMRVNDAVTAFPSILLALVFISLLGFGTYNVILALPAAAGAGGFPGPHPAGRRGSAPRRRPAHPCHSGQGYLCGVSGAYERHGSHHADR